MTTRHSLLDNKVQLYMRANSPHWQCSCSIAGKQRRTSTKEESLSRAKDVARDWYLGLMGKYRAGELKEGVTFRTAAEHFVKEFEVITEGERSKEYIKSLSISLNVHLLPFMGDRVVTDIMCCSWSTAAFAPMRPSASRYATSTLLPMGRGRRRFCTSPSGASAVSAIARPCPVR